MRLLKETLCRSQAVAASANHVVVNDRQCPKLSRTKVVQAMVAQREKAVAALDIGARALEEVIDHRQSRWLERV